MANVPRYHRTPQREAILEYVSSCREHLSAEAIHAALRRTHPRLSTSSVYRNLHVLVAQGKLSVLQFGSGQDLYDRRTDPHYHLNCRSCGALSDLELPELAEAVSQAATGIAGFTAEGHTLIFHGLCNACSNGADHGKKRGQHDQVAASDS